MGSLTTRLLPLVLSLAIAGCGFARPMAPERLSTDPRAASLADGAMATFMDEVFANADTDGNGKLSQAESGLLAEQIAAMDRDGDGEIAKREFNGRATLGQIREQLPLFLSMVLALHTQLDLDGDRHVSLAEVQSAVAMPGKGGDELRPHAVADTFQTADTNHDGGLTGAEFQDFYLNLVDLPERGLFRRIGWALLGTYLNLTSRIVVKKALHGERSLPKTTPADLGLPYETVTLKTSDQLMIKGWYVPAKIKTDKAILLLHGRGDNRSMFVRQRQLAWLHPEYNVLAIDLRNHGESEGNVTTFAYGEGRDALAGLDYLKRRGNRHLGVYGISLGGATAIRAAALSNEVKAVVDDCAYATVVSAFKGFISFMWAPNPVLIASAAVTRANRMLGIDMTTSEPLEQVEKIAPRPFLVIHGEADQYITVENSRINYKLAGSGLQKELWVVPGAKHAVSASHAPAAYREKLLGFFRQAL